ncbi:MAG: hypothetical protein QW292_09225 [Candidatus Parvarchaeota archaeon]
MVKKVALYQFYQYFITHFTGILPSVYYMGRDGNEFEEEQVLLASRPKLSFPIFEEAKRDLFHR